MSSRADKVVDFKDFGERPARGLDTALYIGSKLTAKSQGMLRSMGVKYILNCTPTRNLDPEAGCPNFFEKDAQYTYKRIPIFDNRGEDILQYMDQAIAFIEQGKHYGSVLVHCVKGVSRSASFVLGYLMKTGGMELDAALAMLKSKRSIVAPNDSFTAQLRAYDARLKRERAEAAAKREKQGGGGGGGGPAPASASPAKGPAKGAARGPIGPSGPPSSAAPMVGPSPQPPPAAAAEGTRPGIGPSMPPRAPIGPAMPPGVGAGAGAAKRQIGPARPPGPDRPDGGGGEEEEEDGGRKRPRTDSGGATK